MNSRTWLLIGSTLLGAGAAGSAQALNSIIIDNTPNPGTPGVVTNMATATGGKNFGYGDSFNISGIQVMQRSPTNTLIDEVGVTNPNSTSYANYGKATELKYFANGQHLFDLDRFRTAADWMRANIAVTASHPAGTFGTISWTEFLQNIAAARTMYGVVRIKVPLELGTSNSTKNALGVTVSNSTIYGFCATTSGLCSSAPDSSTNIKPGSTINGVAMGANPQLRVRGALMFDFVNNQGDTVLASAGSPIPLSNLPTEPRKIYFKVSVPINVNAANDANGDGVMDNIDYIDGLTAGVSSTTGSYSINPSPAIDFNKVPQESKDGFAAQFGKVLNTTTFAALNVPNQYHLLMPSGYVQGWYDAFKELNITVDQWKALGFRVPTVVSGSRTLTVAEIRDNRFEDIPVYIYTGGLVDMHHHTNISGLVYVPQAMELEQKSTTSRQYIMGGVVIRDGFYIEAGGGATLISSDPSSFASIRVLKDAISGGAFSYAVSYARGAGASGNGGAGSDSSCYGCSGATTSSDAGTIDWVEIRPQ